MEQNKYQSFFEFMQNEHGLTLLESEMQEIISEAKKVELSQNDNQMKQRIEKIKQLLGRLRDAAISDKTIKATMFEIGSVTSQAYKELELLESESIIKCSEGFTETTFPECKCVQVTNKVLSEQERFEAVKNGSLSLVDYAMQKVDERPVNNTLEFIAFKIKRAKAAKADLDGLKVEWCYPTKSSDLYKAYCDFCQTVNQKPSRTDMFSQALISSGFSKIKSTKDGCIYWNVILL